MAVRRPIFRSAETAAHISQQHNVHSISLPQIMPEQDAKPVAEKAQLSMDKQLTADAFSNEPLLMENKDRFVLFPIQHNDIWQFYKKHEASILDRRGDRHERRPRGLER
jgi:hypothetical protein